MRKKIELPKLISLLDILGKKVVALKGFRTDMRKKRDFSIIYILFDDGETFLELEDQDYITYHDCDTFAKRIHTFINKKQWDAIMADEKHYPDADADVAWC